MFQIAYYLDMPRLSEFYGIVIYMYFNDHNPPHFHAIYGGFEAEILISSVTVHDGYLPKRALKLVQTWARNYRHELLANWNRAHSGRQVEPIPPLE